MITYRYSMNILDWNPQGHISPIYVNEPTSSNRSPYKISLLEFYKRFSTSDDRKKILDGLIAYREKLHSLGFNKGFQWVDGSFLELIEKKEGRSPRDIDVVTFIEEYPTDIQENLTYIQNEFKNVVKPLSKQQFMCDAFVLIIPELTPKQLIDQTAYWYGVWSHTRELHWKGFVEIDLDPSEDLALSEFQKGDSQ